MTGDTIYVQTAGVIGTAQTLIGSTIPEGFVREITRIVASADDGSEQNLAIYQGDTSDTDRTTKAIIRVPDVTNAPPLNLAGDPLIVLRPTRTAGTVTNNAIYLSHETSAINVTITYRDVRE